MIRTKERLLLENKVYAPQNVLNGGKPNKWTAQVAVKSLEKVREDLAKYLPQLDKLLYVTQQNQDLPVAFASNALYVLERNGGGNREYYETVLLPVLRKKLQYLHAEGVAQTAWALSNAQIWDS